MAITYVIVVLVASSVAVFAVQNSGPIAVHFLVWTAPETPVAMLTIGAFVAGLIVASIPFWLETWRLRRRAKELALRLRQSEAARADRERALLNRPRRPLGDPSS